MDATPVHQPIIPPLQSVPVASKQSHLMLLIAGLALFFGGLGGGLILSQFIASPKPIIEPKVQISEIPTPLPTPDPTVNWKTYTNQKLGFSLKYPQDWHDPVEKIQSTSSEVDFDPSDANLMVRIGFDINQTTGKNFTLDETIGSASAYAKSKSDYSLDGIKGKKIESVMGASSLQVTILAPLPKTTENILVIQYVIPFNLLEPSRLFDQILSTFKFL